MTLMINGDWLSWRYQYTTKNHWNLIIKAVSYLWKTQDRFGAKFHRTVFIFPSLSIMRCSYYSISVKGIPSALLVSDSGDVEQCLLDGFRQAELWHPSEHRAFMLLPHRGSVMSLLRRLPLWFLSTGSPNECLFLRPWNLPSELHMPQSPQPALLMRKHTVYHQQSGIW